MLAMVSGQVFRLVRKRNGRIVVITGFYCQALSFCRVFPVHICMTHMEHTCHSYVPVPTVLVIYIYTRSGARFARPLLACACISFVYLLHGRLLLVPLYSLSKLNNNSSKARYLNWFKFHKRNYVTSRDLTSLTTKYLLPPFSQSASPKAR